MQRFAMVTLALVLTLGALLATRQPLRISAQAGTPAVGVEIAPGVIAQFLGESPAPSAEGQTLYLLRATVAPGAGLGPHLHPGTTLVSIESGTLTWTLVEGTAWVTRSGDEMSPEKLTDPGTEVLLGPGDGVYFHQDAVHADLNAGDEPLVFLDATLLETDRPLLIPAGTPTP